VGAALEAYNLERGIDREAEVREAVRGGRAMARARPSKPAEKQTQVQGGRTLSKAAGEVLREEGFTPTILLGVCLIVLSGALGSWVGSGGLAKVLTKRRRRTGLQDGDVNRVRGSYESFDKNSRVSSGKVSRLPMEEALNVQRPKSSPKKSQGGRKPRRPANMEAEAPSLAEQEAAAATEGREPAESQSASVQREDAAATSDPAEDHAEIVKDVEAATPVSPSLPPGMPTLADAAASRAADPRAVAKAAPKASPTLPPMREAGLPMGILITDADTAKGAVGASRGQDMNDGGTSAPEGDSDTGDEA